MSEAFARPAEHREAKRPVGLAGGGGAGEAVIEPGTAGREEGRVRTRYEVRLAGPVPIELLGEPGGLIVTEQEPMTLMTEASARRSSTHLCVAFATSLSSSSSYGSGLHRGDVRPSSRICMGRAPRRS